MGWEKKGKGFLHFNMCIFLSFIFLYRLQDVVNKHVASHESEKMMPKTTNIVKNGLTYVGSSSQRVVDELKVSFEENMTKDKVINNFLIAMEQITSGDDLQDFSNQVLFNQVTSEKDEKKIVSMKDESFPFNQG
jgi:hypothetical protein